MRDRTRRPSRSGRRGTSGTLPAAKGPRPVGAHRFPDIPRASPPPGPPRPPESSSSATPTACTGAGPVRSEVASSSRLPSRCAAQARLAQSQRAIEKEGSMTADDVDTVFVSYSRNDEQLVSTLVTLLRAVHGLVFQDTDSIRPGERWRDEIDSSITRSSKLLVFWCAHSSRSEQVAREYQLGLSRRKVLIPVLLDDTPLVEELSPYQWLDMRQLAQDHERPPRPSARRRVLRITLAIGLLTVLVGSALTLCGNGPGAGEGPPSSDEVILAAAFWILVGLTVVGSLAAYRRAHRRSRERSAAAMLAERLRTA